MSALRSIRIVAWSLVGLVALGAGAVYLARGPLADFLRGGVARAAVGGPFDLVDHEGKPVSDRTLRGKPYLVFFGFTHCPDVCPTAMFELSEALKEAGPEAKDLNAFFVSVDPDRDTPELLKLYLSSFDPRIRALTGPVEKIDAMVRAWRAHYRKVPLEKGAYTVDHTVLIYLMDRNGAYFDLIRPNEGVEARVRKIRALVAKG